MTDSEMNIEVKTSWHVSGPITISGHIHNIPFENKGTIIQFSPPHNLQYSHLSSLSNLPDIPENHSILTFSLVSGDNATTLTLTVAKFPTESIYKHLLLYWTGTLDILKNFAEHRYQKTS